MKNRLSICSSVGTNVEANLLTNIHSIAQIEVVGNNQGSLSGIGAHDFLAFVVKCRIKPDDSTMLQDAWVVIKITQKIVGGVIDVTGPSVDEAISWVSSRTNTVMIKEWKRQNAINPSDPPLGVAQSNVLNVFTSGFVGFPHRVVSITVNGVNILGGQVFDTGNSQTFAQAVVDSINSATSFHGFSAIKRFWNGSYSIYAPLESGPKYNSFPIVVTVAGDVTTDAATPEVFYTPSVYENFVQGYNTKDEAINAYKNGLCGWTHLGTGVDTYFWYNQGML